MDREEKRKRVVIEKVQPEVDCGRFPIKRVSGEKVVVLADIFADGHDAIGAMLLYRREGENDWHEVPMRLVENDRWRAEFTVDVLGHYYYTLEGWVDHFKTWRHGLGKKHDAGLDVGVELQEGARYIAKGAERAWGRDGERLRELSRFLIEAGNEQSAVEAALSDEVARLMAKYPDREFAVRYERELDVVVESPKALFSTWYERFPRSSAAEPGKHGTLKDCEMLLPEIARMGFDVFYLPPIHPIGYTNRKGKNNSPAPEPDDCGSPWAIGSHEGGHKAVHPALGTLADFERLVEKARSYGIEIALDLAFQCSPDHPYVKEHPEWFKTRPDGSIQYAENPPKKYEDIFPLDFETLKWRELWEELKSVVLFWIDRGVRIFRVDNPHTKSFAFWEWLIAEIRRDHPDVIFLAEAFTRPKVMYRLAKLGFSQSYTYFTWRHSKREFTDYLTELALKEPREFFRPNFWPNTPDILSEYLQYGGRPAFLIRLILAATLCSNYGIYGPPFELVVNQALSGKEEYLGSEKYEIKHWNWDQPGNLKDFIARLNRIRRENSAFHTTWNLKFYEVDNENLLFFGKTGEGDETILVVVNLDPFNTQAGWLKIPIGEFGLGNDQPYLCHDLLSEEKFIWHGERNRVELNPHMLPAHIFKVRKRLRRETDFDYFL